jgi:Holliday junction resolvasome RuvABC endonuclease subunit
VRLGDNETLLALDLSTEIGWCVGAPPDVLPRTDTFVLPQTGDNVGRFAAAFEDWFVPFIREVKPRALIFEAPNLSTKTTPATIIKLYGLCFDAEKIAYRHGIRSFKVGASQIKKFFAGHGRAEKEDMVAAARRHGWPVQDHHQADAAACWAWGIYCFAPDHAKRFALGLLGAGR